MSDEVTKDLTGLDKGSLAQFTERYIVQPHFNARYRHMTHQAVSVLFLFGKNKKGNRQQVWAGHLLNMWEDDLVLQFRWKMYSYAPSYILRFIKSVKNLRKTIVYLFIYLFIFLPKKVINYIFLAETSELVKHKLK